MDLNKILPYVQRPARYIGGEWNAIRVENGKKTRLCFCFPDLYELGTSSLGLEMLYKIVNSREDFSAERCFSPDSDFESILKEKGLFLYSLETKTPLRDFDVLGFSLQYELSLTNVLAMLDSGGVSVFSKDRKVSDPLVVAGGPLTVNPEPFADFFDAVIVGDGEDVIIEVLTALSSLGRRPERRGVLKEISKISGVYVPSFYTPRYESGVFSGMVKTEASAPETISKRIYDINRRETSLETKPTLPNVESVHSRLNVEIARGCPHGCLFCQARNYYWPWRVRPVEVIKSVVREGIKNTGYDAVAFLSLSSGDYPDIEKLVSDVLVENNQFPFSVSLPSLHCERFTKDISRSLSSSASRPSLTFAPEAGSERLRFSIGKNLKDDAVFGAISNAVAAGWKQLKLYFMYGLPGETENDLAAICSLVGEIKKRFRSLGLKTTLSPFVPKPQTAFEREKQNDIEILGQKELHLRKNLRHLGVSVKSHNIKMNFIEGIIARGDRRLSGVINQAYLGGSRFDQWQEKFDFEKWLDAFEKVGINPHEYAAQSSAVLKLPWSHILMRSSETFIPLENTTRPPRKNNVFITEPLSIRDSLTGFAKKHSFRYRFRVARYGLARFISHNDQINIFRMAMRRAGFPIKYTFGFSPQPKISFGPAISVGYESEAEYFEAEFSRFINPDDIKEKFSLKLPENFKLVSARQVPSVFPSVESLSNVVAYTVILHEKTDAFAKIEKFHAAGSVAYDKVSGSKSIRYDLKTIIREIYLSDEKTVFLSETISPGKNLKPEKILSFILNVDERSMFVRRKNFYTIRKDGSFAEL